MLTWASWAGATPTLASWAGAKAALASVAGVKAAFVFAAFTAAADVVLVDLAFLAGVNFFMGIDDFLESELYIPCHRCHDTSMLLRCVV